LACVLLSCSELPSPQLCELMLKLPSF